MRELILGAITDFNELFSLLERNEKSEVGKDFRARCRELPSLMEDIGLVPALSFCYAKATDSVYKEIKRLIESKQKIKDEDILKRAYAIYLYLTLKRLKAQGLIKSDLDSPLNALEELAREEGKIARERIASKLLRPYVVQLKKLSEAVFKAEGEKE